MKKKFKLSFDTVLPFILAALLFVGTTGIVSSHFIAVCLILMIISAKENRIKITVPFQIIFLIIVFSLLNEALHMVTEGAPPTLIEIIPYSLFIFITMWASKVVDERVLKWMMWFTLIDIGAAVIQRIIGVNTFLPGTLTDAGEMGGDLFYDLKVNGLNTNSSGLAYKAFLALIIHERFPKCRIFGNYFWYFICFAGIILAFNRTMLLASFVYFGFKLLKSKHRYFAIPLFALLFVFILSQEGVMEWVISQLTRGGDSFSEGNAMSGREGIYPVYIQFCKDHFFFGNGSFKYYIGEGVHAHNSFLQTMATNGFLIMVLYLFLIYSCIRKKTLIFALLFFVCAMTQAFILWGASYNDFIFYCVLLRPTCDLFTEKEINNKKCVNKEINNYKIVTI